MRRTPLLATIAAALVLAATFTMASAATNEGVVSRSSTVFTWQGRIMTNAYVAPLEGQDCPDAATDPQNTTCDHEKITVDVPSGFWKKNHGTLRIVLKPELSDSFQLFVYDDKGMLVGEADTSNNPTATIPDPQGSYEVRASPFFTAASSYVGTATLTILKGKDPGFPLSGFSAYHAVSSARLPNKALSNKPIRYSGPKLTLASHYIGRGAAEPTTGVDGQGRLYYAAAAFDALPAGSPKQLPKTLLLRSDDKGRTWQVKQPGIVNGTQTDGEVFTGDPYTYVDQTTGRVFMVDLKELTSSTVDHSDDGGDTWTRSAAMSPGVNDHQTVFSGPVPKGSPLVTTDPKFPEIVYYCVNQITSADCMRSLDGGVTFVNTGQPSYYGFDTEQTVPFCGSLHGHIRSDFEGRIFVPRGQCGTPYLSISENAGATWRQVKVADPSFHVPDQTTAMNADSAGNLYYVFWDRTFALPWLTISRDHGVTWSTPLMIAPPGVHEVNFPTIAAGDAGRIAITFPGSTATDRTDLSRPWNSYVVESADALSANPTFISNIANPGGAKDPIHRGMCSGRCGRMYDFLDIHIAPDARGTIVATATDTCTAVHLCSTVRYAGATKILQGKFQGVSSDMQGVSIRQITGLRLRVRGTTHA